MSAGSIWIVDDDDDCRYLFSRLIGLALGIKRPSGFCSAEVMLAALKQQPPPAVILMDVQMPGMSGIEAIPFVHQLAPDTRVVIITSCADGEKRRQALANGAVNFLRKDCPPGLVVEAIHAALRQPLAPPTTESGPVTSTGAVIPSAAPL
jgi:DNA-binding NtrC family response regulator